MNRQLLFLGVALKATDLWIPVDGGEGNLFPTWNFVQQNVSWKEISPLLASPTKSVDS